MKNKFAEYYEHTTQEKIALWKNCVFVYDTNVLLNLYRYSSEARTSLLSSLASRKNKIWIPNQVAFEYLSRRSKVIADSNKRYDNTQLAWDDLASKTRINYYLASDDKSIASLTESIKDWLTKQKGDKMISTFDDFVLTQLTTLFDKRVGDAFDEDKLKEIEKEGKERYAKKTPPGYMDEKKRSTDLSDNIYGDLILWKQMMEYAKESKSNIIFVTDDKKEDWWNIVDGKTIGPRAELRKEFVTYTKMQFHMYTMEQYLKFKTDDKETSAEEKSVIDEVTRFNSLSWDEIVNGADTAAACSMDLHKSQVQIKTCQIELQQEKKAAFQLIHKYGNDNMPEVIKNELITRRLNIDIHEKVLDSLIVESQVLELRLIHKLEEDGYYP